MGFVEAAMYLNGTERFMRKLVAEPRVESATLVSTSTTTTIMNRRRSITSVSYTRLVRGQWVG